MKTQVIQLDKHDDVISVRDKMSWSKSERILLVFPRGGRILKRRLDLHLLQRHAEKLGAQLAIVTRSRDLRETAQKNGISVYRVVSTAQRRTWTALATQEKPARWKPPVDLRQMRGEVYGNEPRWQSLGWVRLVFFSVAVLAVLTLLVLFLPSASLRLSPKTRLQSLAIQVSASAEINSVQVTGDIPARLTSTVVQKVKTAAVTGSTSIPDAKAKGMLRFRNLTNGTVGIPAGTIVRTTGNPPVRFVTTVDAALAAPAGKTVDVAAVAVEGGTAGNLAADTLIAIEGELGTSIAVINPAATAGGTDLKTPIQTEADRTHLHNALLAEILQDCRNTLNKNLGQGDLAFPDTLKAGQVISETYFPAPTQAGSTLSLTLEVQCQMQYATAKDVRQLAEMALDVNLPEGYQALPENDVAIAAGALSTGTDGITHWQMQAQRLTQMKLDEQAAKRMAQGQRPNEAARRITQALALEGQPQIRLLPSWWPWLPVFPFRITLLING